MKHGSILFLRAVLALVGVGVLAGLIWMPQLEGRNANADLVTIYLGDPFLAYVYVGALPFFFGLYQAFHLLGCVGRGQACSPAAGAEAYILLGPHAGEDRAGGVAMGVLAGFPCLIAATVAAVLERVLQNAVDLKSENDLTV
jgi:hypothetical protein